MGEEVKVYIYDLSKGVAKAMSKALLGKQIDGIWHTAIVVYGKEYFYGGTGIEYCEPGMVGIGPPDEVISLGYTQVSLNELNNHLRQISTTSFRGACYHLLDHNCNNFSNHLAEFLTGHGIPSHITSLPNDVLSTPFGAMIRPFLNEISVNPGAHHTIDELGGQGANGSSAGPSSGRSSNSNDPSPARSILASCYTPQALKSFLEPLSLSERALFQELCEYEAKDSCTWSLSRPHMLLLGSQLKDATSAKIIPSMLLQNLAVREDLVPLILNDEQSGKCLCHIFKNLDAYNVTHQEHLLKALMNFAGHQSYLQGVSESKKKPNCRLTVDEICKVCNDFLVIEDNDVLNSIACGLCYNLLKLQLPMDTYTNFGMALVHVAAKNISPEYREYCLHSMLHCMKKNNEVTCLAVVMALNVQHLTKDDSNLKSIEKEITTLMETI